MTNKQIAAAFKLLAALMELHGESPFKIKTYQNAVRTIEKSALEFTTMNVEDILTMPGIGAAVGAKTRELLETGQMQVLEAWIEKTPKGVIDMLQVKGLGPKKVKVIWEELGIENLGELLYACEENRLMLLKGFGEKTQNNIKDAILFYQDQAGQFLYAQVEELSEQLAILLDQALAAYPGAKIRQVGAYKRQLPVIDQLQWVTTLAATTLVDLFKSPDFASCYPTTHQHEGGDEKMGNYLQLSSDKRPDLYFLTSVPSEAFEASCFYQNGSPEFIAAFMEQYAAQLSPEDYLEEQVFKKLQLSYIPTPQREGVEVLTKAARGALSPLIEVGDIKGIIHCHSRYSDGGQTLKEMAIAAKQKGFEYLMISDHSQSAGYAGGLKPARILEQHAEIAELNQSLAPFKIFKSIESDILRHGELDYSEDVLSSFDLVIASVHSVLKMDIEDATARLLKAIENPYTHILGHMTGRLLLSRKGYPLHMDKILDACAANKVVIEINANPRRLDIDWSWIPKALDKGILLSIDPDAHSIRGMEDIRYGVLAAQKGGLSAQQNLSSYSLFEMEDFIKRAKLKLN